EMTEAGFEIKMGTHPIVPIMIYDAILAKKMAELLLDRGIYVVGFFYPVVPKNKARIRVQISAEMDINQLSEAISIFIEVGKILKIN
ncbi:MAG: aminotransferase class I/II-fold pyridoxal phosphate-dependent enzyme, partial [Candidatus Marinimicrobia bacterium]|nr:aminotransferase class I/II-fold pyridoxal phosphate-dependent enzyme [Candidatus Neomarinimicrobiota bacterium]